MNFKKIGLVILIAVAGAVAFRKISALGGLLDKVGL